MRSWDSERALRIGMAESSSSMIEEKSPEVEGLSFFLSTCEPLGLEDGEGPAVKERFLRAFSRVLFSVKGGNLMAMIGGRGDRIGRVTSFVERLSGFFSISSGGGELGLYSSRGIGKARGRSAAKWRR